MKRNKIVTNSYIKLIVVSLLVAIVSAILAFTLKHLTELSEHFIFTSFHGNYSAFYILLPTIGITSIYFLRKYLFKKRSNKGITEIYKTLDKRKDHLPLFKITSHYINGFLTVVFGGSTGIEVSTVVSTATIGNYAYSKERSAKMYKRELICAGVTAGVAILFSSPLAGWLFSMEVIARKINKTLIISCTTSALISWLFIVNFDNTSLLHSFPINNWNWSALPFFILLGLFGGTLAVYFTLLVTRIKKLFASIKNNFVRVNTGALTVGIFIFFFPMLYGDSYHGFLEILQNSVTKESTSIFLLFLLVILKPLVAALTLGAGGDGGVFAPSIIVGAFLGLFVAMIINHFFDLHLIPLNFAMVGAAATLSASLYAPVTAVILICNILPNGFVLFVPVLLCSFISYYFSKRLLPYNVYTYDNYLISR